MQHYHKNPRRITDQQQADLRKWLRTYGDLSGIVHNVRTDEIIGGNQRVDAMDLLSGRIHLVITKRWRKATPQGTIAVGYFNWHGDRYAYRRVDWTRRKAEAANVIANRAGGSWDFQILADQFDVKDLMDWGFDAGELTAAGMEVPDGSDDSDGSGGKNVSGTLAERFGVPPFSVLDARQGYWQDRKAAWIQLGIQGEQGRGDGGDTFGSGAPGDLQKQYVNGVLMKSDSGNDPAYYFKKQKKEKELGRKLSTQEFQDDYYDGPDSYQAGTSIFDPVLCELVYRWFAPVGGSVLDPFAGESTKGIVASYLKHPYTGIELRKEQVDANKKQARAVGVHPQWVCGDSSRMGRILSKSSKYDLIFTSPPYYDLEVYSASKKDGSALQTYAQFMDWYRDIFRQTTVHLRDNRFLVVKIGEIRDKKTGIYRNFLGDNIACFRDLGLTYYNELVLVTAVGSLGIRVGKQFSGTRKIGKTHQNVLVFYKGHPSQIKQHFSKDIEYADLSGEANQG